MEKIKINLNVPVDVLEIWDKEAQQKGITRTALIISAVTDYCKSVKYIRDTNILDKLNEIQHLAENFNK